MIARAAAVYIPACEPQKATRSGVRYFANMGVMALGAFKTLGDGTREHSDVYAAATPL